jgi:cytoskeletal protein CcmA (bactofilin family)
MFRRPGKNQEENSLFEENAIPSPFNKYSSKKNENQEMKQRMFEPPMPRTTPLESHEEQWSDPKKTALPHHFEGIIAEEAPETTLGAGVTFRGQLSFERFLRIDGSFEGELLSQGKVVVGPTGKVKANLNLREAIIEGCVDGNITVQEKLELRGEAVITGDIQARSLCVDEGVSIIGQVIVSPKADPDTPQPPVPK